MTTTILVCLIAVLIPLFIEKEWGLKVAFLLLGVFIAIRFDFGSDYQDYLNGFILVKQGDYEYLNSFSKNEWLWIVINFLCRPIGYFGLNILLAAFDTYVLYRFVKKYVPKQWYFLAVFLYAFSFEYFLIGAASMLRQWLAICIFVLASQFIIERKPVKYFVIIAMASLIHHTSIILFPFYFVTYLKGIKLTYINIIVFLGAIAAWWLLAPSYVLASLNDFFGDTSEMELYGDSLRDTATVVSMGFGILTKVFLVFICLIHFNVFDERVRILLLLYGVSLIFIPLMGISSLAGRFTMYFSVFSIAVIPIVSSHLKKKNQPLLLAILLIVFVINMYDFIGAFSRDEIWNIADYQTIFSTTWQ